MQILYGLTQYETPGLMVPEATWDDLVELCDSKRGIVRSQADKPKSGWMAPAILQDGATSRKLIDVERMAAWIGLDLDHANWTLRQVINRFRTLACVIYSTTRSTALERRWRVVTPLSREMTTAEFAGVWKAWNVLLDGEVDASTKNLNRLHYLPSTWYDEHGVFGNNEYHVQDGRVMDVDDLLMICPPEEPLFYPEVYQTDGVKRPDGTDIITEAMIGRHMFNGQAGGRFMKLLCAAATMHKANGWALSASELANAALQVSPVDSSGMRRAMNAQREAERAISYINSRQDTVSPKDKLLNNLKWRYSRA
jgi:hypothetical protein